MPIRVYYEVLNQKGTPALYSDNYAQRPAAGYQGRIFYSPDTAQIFYDTGSTWTLLADAGVGSGSLASVCANGNTTATGISITAGGLSTNSLTSTNLTAGSIPFIGTGGLFSQDNTNLFWDNTSKYFGINTNTPSTYLDVHGTNNVLVQINNTTTADSKIAFLQAGAGKWRIGNLYSGGTNLFHIYNNTAISLAMQIDSSNAALFYGSLSANSFVSAGAGVLLTNGSVTTSAGKTGIGGLTAGLSIALASGFNQTLTFPTGVAYTYTYPAATGTLALTSDLSSYLPLTGGTLSGALTINSTLYINPTNTGLTGLDVASNTTSFRSDNLEGSKRQLTISMASGTLIQFTGQGYGAARTTDIAFYTSSASGVNSSPAIYITGGNNVGIGTGSPSSILDVRFSASSTGSILNIQNTTSASASNIVPIRFFAGNSFGGLEQIAAIWAINPNAATNNGGALVFATSLNGTSTTPTEYMRIENSGDLKLGVGAGVTDTKFLMYSKGTTSSTYGLVIKQSNGTTNVFYTRDDTAIFFTNNYSFTTGSAANMFLDTSGVIQKSVSSIKYKENVNNYSKGLDIIKQLRPVEYTSKNSITDGNKIFAGFIAEEVHDIGLTEFVQYAEDGTPDALAYQNMTALLTKGIQQLDTRLTNVEEALLTLQQNLN
jgi:hypothetical protein